MNYVLHFFTEDIVGLLACIGLLVIMHLKSRVGKKNVWSLRAGIIVTLVILVSEYADYKMGMNDYGGGWRYLTSTLNYILRPLQCMFLIFQMKNSKKWIIGLTVPWIIYAILFIINLPTHFIFHFNPSFGATGLGRIRIYFPIVYIALVFIASLTSVKEKDVSEVILVCVLGVAIIAATVIDWQDLAGQDRLGCINSCVAVCYVFYYLYLHISAAKRDALTDLLNRQTFYDDVKNREKEITAVISLDMNDLKLVNDTKGHNAGDDALLTLTRIFRKNSTRGTRIYRTGGDEFIILCFGLKKDAINLMIQSIYDDTSKTEYSCAIGYGLMASNKTFDQVLAEADEAMYEKKRSMKTTEVR